jgi:hypothetical protein
VLFALAGGDRDDLVREPGLLKRVRSSRDWESGTSAAGQANVSDAKIEKAGLILWTGGYDRIYQRPDELIAAIKPYAAPFDPDILRQELLKDQVSDDGKRICSVCLAPYPRHSSGTTSHCNLITS